MVRGAILELFDIDQGFIAGMIKTEETPSLWAPGRRVQPSEVPSRPAQAGDDGSDLSEIVIRPQPGWIAIDWKEMFAYRELLLFLVWRDISVRYKQTVLGSCVGDLAAPGPDGDLLGFLRAVCADGSIRQVSPTRCSSSPD